MNATGSENYAEQPVPSVSQSEQQASGLTRPSGGGPEEVTRRLLDSAVTVFGDRGFDAATVSEIARGCDLTTGAIYARWASKREMFIATVEHASAQRMLLLIKNLESTTAEKLSMLGTNLLTDARDQTRNLWIEACVAGSRDESLQGAIAQAQETKAVELAEIVEAGKAEGVIDPSLSTDAVVFLCQSLGLGTYLALRSQAPERPRPDDDEWNPLMARLIDSLRPPASD